MLLGEMAVAVRDLCLSSGCVALGNQAAVSQEKTDVELLELWAARSSLLQEGWVRVSMPPSRAATPWLQKKQPGNATGICRSWWWHLVPAVLLHTEPRAMTAAGAIGRLPDTSQTPFLLP